MRLRSLVAVLFALTACADDPIDNEDSRFGTKGDGAVEEGSAEARAVLTLVNDPTVGLDELDDDAGLNARAATNIIEHRDGPDGEPQTFDDNPFDDLAELDDVKFVGPIALSALLAHAKAKGLVTDGATLDVIFSPQPEDRTHAVRVAEIIDAAEVSLDIAMYSFSNAGISDALERAVARGVEVRFIFETANKDKNLDESERASSKSGRLERAGVDVRFVNKIMHHKFVIADGPRDDLARAATATMATGSANWSHGAATIYDENTVFATNMPELALRMQREFNLMWSHSRDLVLDTPREHVLSSLQITDDAIASQDDPGVDLVVTSDNFDVRSGSTTFRTDRAKLTASDAWVAAIEGATDSIFVASGHLRLRPVAEALVAKKQANPEMDIRVYLDGQEFISRSGDFSQVSRLETCLANAEDDRDEFNCLNKSFRFSKMVADAGVDLRFKHYAFRWHFSYAPQMHHKYMIIDGDELFTGSYNLSINAEHSTFENVMRFAGPAHGALVDRYTDNFVALFETGRADGLLDDLRAQISGDATFPIVYSSMALSWQEVSDLRDLIIANCGEIFSDEFRRNAPAHRSCSR